MPHLLRVGDGRATHRSCTTVLDDFWVGPFLIISQLLLNFSSRFRDEHFAQISSFCRDPNLSRRGRARIWFFFHDLPFGIARAISRAGGDDDVGSGVDAAVGSIAARIR